MERDSRSYRRKLGFIGGLVLILNILAVIALSLSYLSGHVSPEKSWILPFFGLLYPYLFMLNLLFILYWAVRFKWPVFISLIAVLAGWQQVGRTVQWMAKPSATENHWTFRLMSYNVKNLSNDNVRLVDAEVRNQILHYLKSENPDILCLQEFYLDHPDPEAFIDSISAELGLPYHDYATYAVKATRRIGAIFTFSRFPIIHSKGLKKDETHHYSLYSDIATPGDTFRLFNVHLESVRFRQEDYKFISDLDLQFEQNENISEGSRRILSKLKSAYARRAGQVDSLVSLIETSPYPVILCGDFNDTPASYTYRQLTKKLKDAFVESGSGFGNTYIGKLPSFRIDYILVDEYFATWEFERDLVRYSDHYPVSCHIGKKFQEEKQQ